MSNPVIPEAVPPESFHPRSVPSDRGYRNPVIPDEAVEAAVEAHCEGTMRAALEAAYPIMLSHEREQTRLAHVDAVVNAQTADRLERGLEGVRAELLRLAKEFDTAVGGSLAYTTTDGRHQMRKNAHDQLMHIVENCL